jgi:hypothetical protein
MNQITKLKTIKLLSSPKYTILDIVNWEDYDGNKVLKLSVRHNRTNKEYTTSIYTHDDLQSNKQHIHTRGLI